MLFRGRVVTFFFLFSQCFGKRKEDTTLPCPRLCISAFSPLCTICGRLAGVSSTKKLVYYWVPVRSWVLSCTILAPGLPLVELSAPSRRAVVRRGGDSIEGPATGEAPSARFLGCAFVYDPLLVSLD